MFLLFKDLGTNESAKNVGTAREMGTNCISLTPRGVAEAEVVLDDVVHVSKGYAGKVG